MVKERMQWRKMWVRRAIHLSEELHVYFRVVGYCGEGAI